MKKKHGRPQQLRLRKRTILVLNEDQVGEVAGAGSNISCDGGDCHGNGTGNGTDCWETCNTCPDSCNAPCNPPTCNATCVATCQTVGCGCVRGGVGGTTTSEEAQTECGC